MLIIFIVTLATVIYLASSNFNSDSIIKNGYNISVPLDFNSEKISDDTYRIIDMKSGSYMNIKLEDSYAKTVEMGMNPSNICIQVLEECIKLSLPSKGSQWDYYQIVEYDNQSNPDLDVRHNIDLMTNTYYGIKYIEDKYTRDYSNGNYFIKKFNMLGYQKVSVALAISRYEDYNTQNLFEQFSRILENMITAQKWL
jgi:hypothetical protein